MINLIINVFNSEDLPGADAIMSLKTYHNFFAHKINDSSGLAKSAWIIVNVVTGILAYPLFGTLALIGMIANFCGIPALRDHNNEQLDSAGLHQFGKWTHFENVFKPGYYMKVYRVTFENFAEQKAAIYRVIGECNQLMKQIYITSVGSGHSREVAVHLPLGSAIED